MTTLENRSNTALVVIDVQNGVVKAAHRARRRRREHRRPCRQGAARTGPRRLGPALRRAACEGERRLADRPRAGPGRRRAAGREELRRRLRGHQPRDRAVRPRSRAPHRRRRTNGCVRPLDAPRSVCQGVRRDPCQRRPHDRGPHGMGGTPAGPGHRPHEPVLDLPDGPRADGRDGRDQGRRLRRRVLTPVRRRWEGLGTAPAHCWGARPRWRPRAESPNRTSSSVAGACASSHRYYKSGGASDAGPIPLRCALVNMRQHTKAQPAADDRRVTTGRAKRVEQKTPLCVAAQHPGL